MKYQQWDFSLLDTGFFRSGQPYNAGEGGHTHVQSMFPPDVHTLQGAIRTTLARETGWLSTNNTPWPKELGDEASPGELEFRGPYIVCHGEIYYPAPWTLLVKENSDQKLDWVFLIPGKKPVTCDIGKRRLPQPERSFSGGKLPEGIYFSTSNYSEVLNVNNPCSTGITNKEKLYKMEPRVGLERDDRTRTATDAMLYRTQHVRPFQETVLRILLKAPENFNITGNRILPLGGEGRLSEAKVSQIDDKKYYYMFPSQPDLLPNRKGKIQYTLTLITPGYFSNLENTILNGPACAPGEIVSASLGRAYLLGGWDMKNKRPRSMKPLLPAGSTWYFEAMEEEKNSIKELHGKCLGEGACFGYSQVLVGKWKEDE